MFHVEHGHFFTILNHPFTFVNCSLHPVKYYGGKFANVNCGNPLVISGLRPLCVGAFVTLFSPPRVLGRSLRSSRPAAPSDLRSCRLRSASARPLRGLAFGLLSCRLPSSFGRCVPQWPSATAPVRWVALPSASRPTRSATAPLVAAGDTFFIESLALFAYNSYICDRLLTFNSFRYGKKFFILGQSLRQTR